MPSRSVTEEGTYKVAPSHLRDDTSLARIYSSPVYIRRLSMSFKPRRMNKALQVTDGGPV
jgi:hypothetical protein